MDSKWQKLSDFNIEELAETRKQIHQAVQLAALTGRAFLPKIDDDHFAHFAPMFEIGNEIDFILNETKRLRIRYPTIMFSPMFYRIEDNLLYLIKEK